MHWLHDNWPMVLGWSLYTLSEIMPFLPGKAQNVVGAILNIGKAVLGAAKPKSAPDAPK